MIKGFETALDECLASLAKGESLEACLERFPHYREELEPMLHTATALRRSLTRPTPSQEALARSRARFLAAAEERRHAELVAKRRAVKPAPWYSGLMRLSYSRALATIALTVVLLAGFLGGGSIVSANTLPGDALYGVKRASESVRLWLTIDAERRANLERTYEALRVTEVKQVLDQHRQVTVSFKGIVDCVEGDTIIVNGIAVRLDAVQAARPLVAGDAVQVAARTQNDGSVEAQSLLVRAESTASPTALPTAIPPTSAPVTEAATDAPLPSATPLPTETLLPTATDTATPTEAATVTATNTALPSATATNAPSPTREPSATPVPPPRDVEVRIEGTIGAIASDHWVVDAQRIALRSNTNVNQSKAQAQVGGWAIVNALKSPDGTLAAISIDVVRGPEQPPEPKEFSGTIESIAKDKWVVAGRELWIVSDTTIEGTPAVGATAQVRAELHADGRLVARHIIVQAPERVVQFEGVIESISGERWVVAGQVVIVSAETKIEGEGAVGRIAQVEAVVRADGTLAARRIVVVVPPTPQPTQVPAQPTQTPVQATPAPAAGSTLAANMVP